MRKYLIKILKRYRQFKTHPITSSSPILALFRYVYFNLYVLFDNKPKIYKWINGLKFYAQKGDAGIVPNIYYKLFDFEDSMFILDKITNADVFVDIGANVGHFTMLAESKKSKSNSF